MDQLDLSRLHSGYAALWSADIGHNYARGEQSTREQLRFYKAKTGEHVYVPIPETVASALRLVRRRNPQYFFWSGHSQVQAAASGWAKEVCRGVQSGRDR